MKLRAAFAKAFKDTRKTKGFTQEDFDEVSSRTYVSLIEREKHTPSLDKIEALAKEMKVKPITLLMLSHHYAHPRQSIESQIKMLEKDVNKLITEIDQM